MAQIRETFTTKTMKLHGEIRKVEEISNSFTSKTGKTVETKAVALKIDDDEEERLELFDKSSDKMTTYQKGMVGTFTLRLDVEKDFGVGNYTAKILIIDFEEDTTH